MKVAFAGPLQDLSGFATASRALLKTLHHAGIDLVARALKYDQADKGTDYIPPEWMTELFKKPLIGIDLLIQSTTPNIEAVPAPGVCNAIYTFIETDRIPQHWVDKLNQFDFIIVSSKYNASAMVSCGVTKPIVCMPVPYDISLVKPIKLAHSLVKNADNRTIFYNINQLSGKKGIDLLLRAYFAAFYDRPDEVLLVLKTYINMANRQGEHDYIKQYIQRIKQATRIPIEKWPPIQLITQTLREDQVHELHEECHCYVNTSRSEGYGLGPFDALAHGRTLISNNYGGVADFVKPETALIVGGTMTHCFDFPSPDPFHYTGIAQVFETSTVDLAQYMRFYHALRVGAARGLLDEKNQENWKAIQQRASNGRLVAERHDYRVVADKIVKHFNDAYDSWKKTGKVEFKKEDTNAATN